MVYLGMTTAVTGVGGKDLGIAIAHASLLNVQAATMDASSIAIDVRMARLVRLEVEKRRPRAMVWAARSALLYAWGRGLT